MKRVEELRQLLRYMENSIVENAKTRKKFNFFRKLRFVFGACTNLMLVILYV